METRNKAMITGSPVLQGSDGSVKDWIVFLIPLFVFSLSLIMIYQGMRGVMELGGFVATGGPYEIAHPAPDYVWIFPVFINLMVFSMIGAASVGKKINGPNLMSLSWSALFLSLGWNFTELGILAVRNGEGGIGWIICAVLFAAMGGIPLIVIIRNYAKELEKNRDFSDTIPIPAKILIQMAVAAAGVFLGVRLFGSL